MEQKHTYVVLAGAAPDTANHGVTALAQSTVLGLTERGIDRFSIFDNGQDERPDTSSEWPQGATISRVGFRPGRRVYQACNMHNARLRQVLGIPASAVSAMRNAAAVIDVSGGDSFTDLYGAARFEQILLPKLMALDCGTPLILLPQTYGPFIHERSERLARMVMSRAGLAFARDALSFHNMKQLLGDMFDPQRHRLGVDLAFGLPSEETTVRPLDRPVGLNVSGLLWNERSARDRFGLSLDYRAALIDFVTQVLDRTAKTVQLVPHVTPKGGESDLVACEELRQALPEPVRSRVRITKGADTPATLKRVISSCCWFAGARMHATIAALSTCTPVANMAYSDKALGVFEACGAASEVFDMRRLGTQEMVDELFDAFWTRGNQGRLLSSQVPFVLRRWGFQMDAISGFVKASMLSGSREYA
ncbi:MAG: polysaccharide pyruvyl transferase family protein [Alphaproteobacteria bacterium]|nr:polysaccharide pyruvyl transferase family protein [Alphaproteobacteria bacterium]